MYSAPSSESVMALPRSAPVRYNFAIREDDSLRTRRTRRGREAHAHAKQAPGPAD